MASENSTKPNLGIPLHKTYIPSKKRTVPNSGELIANGSGILIMVNPKIQIESIRFLKTS